jgi:hypothetical protein
LPVLELDDAGGLLPGGSCNVTLTLSPWFSTCTVYESSPVRAVAPDAKVTDVFEMPDSDVPSGTQSAMEPVLVPIDATTAYAVSWTVVTVRSVVTSG